MRIIGTLAISFLCTVVVAANASPPTSADGHRAYQHIQYGGDQDRPNDNADRGRNDERYRDRDGARDDSRDRDRDERNQPRWSAGDRVTNEYLSSRYVIGEWERTGLSRPPRGHEWIRVGDEYMMVRARDRMIAKVIFGDPRRLDR